MALRIKRDEADRLARNWRLAADVAALPVADDRTADDLIGYDDAGFPH